MKDLSVHNSKDKQREIVVKSKHIIPLVIFFVILLTGCASVNKGRFSLLDLDLRTPEQIAAQVPEKTVIYEDKVPTNTASQVTSQPRVFPFELLFQFLQVMKGRIMIFSFEWENKEGQLPLPKGRGLNSDI